ncbi:hypothetical protein B484DRAFT_406702 [Ochromonadaceae sp. CCMP2298]|nr:hypothetical protein B484DRAFT_406702 [Ochromonadaceae sp. CCMP2298]
MIKVRLFVALDSTAQQLTPDGVSRFTFGGFIGKREQLRTQYIQLMGQEEVKNPRIWRALLDPQPCIDAPKPTYTSPGSAEDCIQVVCAYCTTYARIDPTPVKDAIAAYFPPGTDLSYDLTPLGY